MTIQRDSRGQPGVPKGNKKFGIHPVVLGLIPTLNWGANFLNLGTKRLNKKDPTKSVVMS